MPHLYVNSRGNPWRKHSYSAGNDFDQSPYKYFLRRVMGWKERENKARFLFGRALEEAIQFHHDHDGQGAIEAFKRNWEPARDIPDMQYTKTERDWENLNRAGQDMIRLYIAKQKYLPIPTGARVSFQREFCKEVFKGDPTYGGIEDCGKLDIIAYVDPRHPMLQELEWKPEWGELRPVIIDIKTSGVDFPETRGISAYDAQLRRYSWLSGIRDVGLLWFKKAGTNMQKGSSVSVLVDSGSFKAGEEAVIAAVEGDEGVWLVRNDFLVEDMTRVQDDKSGKTKAGLERKAAWLRQFATLVLRENVTRQRLQFNSGFVEKKSADDAGVQAGTQIVRIVNAWNSKQWPNQFGIRFPHDDRNDPYFRAFVQGDEIFKKQNFTKTDEETLDDLFREEETE